MRTETWKAVLSILLAAAAQGEAMPAFPIPRLTENGDGEWVNVTTRGSPFLNWQESNGFIVCRKPSTGKLVYAVGFDENNTAIPGNEKVRANQEPKEGNSLRRPPMDLIRKGREKHKDTEDEQDEDKDEDEKDKGNGNGGGNGRKLQSDTVSNLVVLIRFKDHLTESLPTQANYNVLFNSIGGDPVIAPTGSIKDYFDTVLQGTVDVQSHVTDWIDISYTEAEAAGPGACFGTCSEGLFRDGIIEALDKLKATMDLSTLDSDGDGFIDALTVIHSGLGAEWGTSEPRIWSHKWALPTTWSSRNGLNTVRVRKYNANPSRWGDGTAGVGSKSIEAQITRIGVIVHEMLHYFGLPDLYDLDFSGNGAGNYDVMANSWGVDFSQRYPGTPSAWSRLQLGIETPTVLSVDGEYLADAGTDVLKVERGYGPKDYLLIEYRRAEGFDKLLDGGVLIWHIDEAKSDNTENAIPGVQGGAWSWPTDHYMVRLIQRDNQYNLERGNNYNDAGDWWQTGSVLSDDTAPSLKSYKGLEDGSCTGNSIEVSIPSNGEPARVVLSTRICNAETNAPTSKPSTAPTQFPSKAPTIPGATASPSIPAKEEEGEGGDENPSGSGPCEEDAEYVGMYFEDGQLVTCDDVTPGLCAMYLGMRLKCPRSCDRCDRNQECADMSPGTFVNEMGNSTSCQNLSDLCNTHEQVRNACPSTCGTCNNLAVIVADKIKRNITLPVVLTQDLTGDPSSNGNATTSPTSKGLNKTEIAFVALGSSIVSFVIVLGGCTTVVLIKKREEKLEESIKKMQARMAPQCPSSRPHLDDDHNGFDGGCPVSAFQDETDYGADVEDDRSCSSPSSASSSGSSKSFEDRISHTDQVSAVDTTKPADTLQIRVVPPPHHQHQLHHRNQVPSASKRGRASPQRYTGYGWRIESESNFSQVA